MKYVDTGRLAVAWLGGVLLITAAGVIQAQTTTRSDAAAAADGNTLAVAEFLPQGKVTGVEAVQLRFDEAAVAFGRPDTPSPVNLQCQGPVPAGQGRWLDDRRWHYVFEHPLPAGVDCVAVANPGFRSLDGRELPVALHYEFNTGAPSVVEFRPYSGWDIDEEQVFILGFDAPVDPEDLARDSYCAIEGLEEKIPVRVASNEHREALLQASSMRVPNDGAMLALLQCARVLPPESEIKLVIGPGVRALGQSDAVPASEHAHVLNYKVRVPFTASLRCTRERAGRPCLPVAPLELVFSAPVPRVALAGISLKGGGSVFEPAPGDGAEGPVSYLNYPGPFPAATTLTLTLPDELRDDAGRRLANADRYPLTIQIADYPPLARFASGSFGVLERFAHAPPETGGAQPAAVPVTLRHIEADPVLRGAHWSAGQVANLRTAEDAEVLRWYARLQRLESGRWSGAQLKDIIAGRAPRNDASAWEDRIDVRAVSLLEQQAGVRRLQLPGETGQEQRPLEVVGIPLEEPGFHVLEIESRRLGASLLENAESMYVRTGVLLTNLAVHMKQGRDDLLVWVTTLDDAQAVAAAEINVLDCNARPLARGRTDVNGVWQLMAALDAPDYCSETGMGGLFVSARIAADHPQAYGSADYAFVLSGWDRGIETWRFNVPTSFDTEPVLLTHTVFDRSLFRAGETVSMKHYLRQETREGLKVPANGRPDRLLIEHQGSSQRHELPVSWEETPSGGLIAINDFSLPVTAQLGSYSVRLTDADQGWYGSSRFRVEEFRLPILAGQLMLHGGDGPDVLVAPESMRVNMQLAWLSGGPAAGQKVALSAVATDRYVHFEDYDDYSFVTPAWQKDGEASEDDAGERRRLFVDARPFVLDANGTATVKIDAVPMVERPQRWQLEASFADPIGEIQTLSRHVDVWPADVQAGLKIGSWGRAGRDIPVSLIALSVDKAPQEGVAMRLLAVERKTYTVRTRMVGGFYSYDSRVERNEIGILCEGLTDATGHLRCQANFNAAGSYEFVAVAEDARGRESRASATLWVSGAGELWFDGEDDDRIDLIPAREEWAPGEEAEFQVRMPFRDAVALVSVEREGVLWAQQFRLSGRNPVIRIPVSASWGPNAYVSVLVLRGRLYELPGRSLFQWGWKRPADWLQAFADNPADVRVTNQVDLAKPSFRFGLSEMRVAAGAGRLRVELAPERDVFQVKEEARVKLRVRHPDGTPAAHASVAFAAVDEALLELAPNDSWALYEAMHPRRSLSVRTATMQMEVVGRRHYGRKAVAAGGGGGAMPTRQLFDTLLNWQPMVVLDSNGEAEVRFRLNDAISRFRLVAVADHGGGSFGSGTASIVTRQDLQLVPGLPPVVREGDQYRVEVTVRNGSDHDREIEVRARYQYQAAETGLPPRKLRLSPGRSGSVSWPVTVPMLAWPSDMAEMTWQFEAGAANLSDRLAVTQRVEPRLPTATFQAFLLGLDAGMSHTLPVAAPTAALRDEAGRVFGGVALDVSASLAGGLEGVRKWWANYPYTCLEQSASQALALEDEHRWQAVLARLSTQMDDDGLLRYFQGTGPGSEVLTAYLISATDEARAMGLAFELPEDALQRMLNGLQAFAEGRIKREAYLNDASLDARRVMAMEALSRHGRVTPAMLGSFARTPDQWSTPAVVGWLSILSRMPAQEAVQRGKAQARHILMARMSVSGASMEFSDAAINSAPSLMATRVSSLSRLMLAVMDSPEWQPDLPRMMQRLLAAQSGGAWAITTENLLALLATRRFAMHFETQTAEGMLQTEWAAPAAGRVATAFTEPAAASAADMQVKIPPVGETATTLLVWPEGEGELNLRHDGEGRAWVGMRAQARIPLAEVEDAGYRIVRRVVPVQRQAAHAWSRGDVYRVELEIHARDAASWVVLSDPIPAGATILGSGLGRDASTPLQEREAGYYPPAFVERDASAYRAYFDYLPAGRIQLSYTVRLNAIGNFVLPPTRVEALYQPDLYGRLPNIDGLTVQAGSFDAQ